jgi:hypothetical protein
MSRPVPVIVGAFVLVGYGVYLLLHLIPLLLTGAVGEWSFLGRLVQCVLALVVGIALWLGRSWAPTGIVILAVALAITVLGEAVVSEIRALVDALLIAVAALVVGFLLAFWVRPHLRP